MPVNRSENTKDIDSATHAQTSGLRFVAIFAGILIALPLLPALISNLTYSFGGHAPKIYWYLSRAGGFIALSILWVSMAMGLGLTNKLARRWPGAPAAFAIHEYVSLLGLFFAVYHGLVLMGDHFVDFSLPHLLVPFSIRYEPFWVGLGQLAFYLWVVVLLSFYVRQFIGQKTWRMIHFANFATYVMGLFHGLFSGTDGTAGWAHWYYGISGGTLLALMAYRIYVTIHKKPASRAERPAGQIGQSPQVPETAVASIPATTAEVVPSTPIPEQVASPAESPSPTPTPTEQPAPAPDPISIATVTENIPQYMSIEQEQLPITEQAPFTLKIFDEVVIPPPDPVLRIKGNPNRNHMQAPTFREPVTVPTLRIKGAAQAKPTQVTEWEKVVIPDIRIGAVEQSKQAQLTPSLLRIKENLHPKPAQPTLVLRTGKRDRIFEN